MSLVGSLEDLSLGDILQIISLSQKSGVLVLRAPGRTGRMVFRSGAIYAAGFETEDRVDCESLRAALTSQGVLAVAEFEAWRHGAPDGPDRGPDRLEQVAGVEAGELEPVIGQVVEDQVLEMFQWPTGNFSFDVRTDPAADDPPILLRSGLNAQYIAMEGVRMQDERAHAANQTSEPVEEAAASEAPDLEFDLLGEDPPKSPSEAEQRVIDSVLDENLPPSVDEVLSAFDAALADAGGSTPEPVPVAESQAPSPEPAAPVVPSTDSHPSTASDSASEATRSRILVLIDPDRGVLEWAKHGLADCFGQVHVFQRADQGLARIRQYLVRAEWPVVMVSPETRIDPLSGIRSLTDFVRRLKAQAPQVAIFALHAPDEPGEVLPLPGAVDGVIQRPTREDLAQAAPARGREIGLAVAAEVAEGLAKSAGG